MNEITIRVVGIPAPQGSKTLTRYGAMIEASKKVKPWRNDVKEAALECYSSGALNMPVKADIEFIFPRPKSHFGSGKNAEILKPSKVTSIIHRFKKNQCLLSGPVSRAPWGPPYGPPLWGPEI